MPAALSVQNILARLTWGLDDAAIESTAQREEAARQLDKLKGSTSRWRPTDTRLTQQVNGVSVLQARDHIYDKIREAVDEGRASRCTKHEKTLSVATAVAEEHEAAAEASESKNARVLRALANPLQEKDFIARAAVVAQHLQLARELHEGEPDEEAASEEESVAPVAPAAAASAAASAVPEWVDLCPKAQADRILQKAAELHEQKALMRATKEAMAGLGQDTDRASITTLLRRLCNHDAEAARQLWEQVDAWSATAAASAAAAPPAGAGSETASAAAATLSGFCILFCCIVLYFIVLYCIILYCIVCVVLCCTVLYSIV